MQCSHLCHHPMCIVHITYESDATNESRKECHRRTKLLRQEGLCVPKICQQHNPPCMMQHAALTTFESFLIQFAVWRQANGIEPIQPPARPVHHRLYSTLEFQAPPVFCGEDSAVAVNPHHLVACDIATRREKPELRCYFCSSRIKAYAGIAMLWKHFVSQHYKAPEELRFVRDAVEEDHLLAEVRRTAVLWHSHWKHQSNGSHLRTPTMKRLLQAGREDFCWNDVLDWFSSNPQPDSLL